MRSRSARMASLLGVCENFTYTRVPPRKSTPIGMPCQNSMESTPATLNTSEKARKYHFFPRKSIFGLRKNSTPFESLLKAFRVPERSGLQNYWLANPETLPSRPPKTFSFLADAQRFATLLTAQHPVENHARNE